MTIVVAISVADGLVMASDSATTQQVGLPGGLVDTINIWNSANKIFNLRKGLPIGAMTFGRANFQGRSIASHCKDLRSQLAAQMAGPIAALDPQDYDIEGVARSVEAHFNALFAVEPGDVFGMLVGGYGSGDVLPSIWELRIDDSGSHLSQPLADGEAGIFQQGQPEAIARLVDGVSTSLEQALINLGAAPADAEAYAGAIKNEIGLPIVHAGMPLGEAIDLADFLVDATIKFVRFTPGDAFVGGPIEIAVMTKHEGFKWIKRKHYYATDLNP